jgi:branched-chain amino acid transport system permease protein
MRAVADDHQAAALSAACRLPSGYWYGRWQVCSWSQGSCGGLNRGVVFIFDAVKRLPVLMLGGFTSIPGRRGLIIGVGESCLNSDRGGSPGGATENCLRLYARAC